MIRYELRKLIGNRFLMIALAVLLLFNCGLAYYSASASHETPVSDAQKEFLTYYLHNTAEVEAYAAEIEAFDKEQLELEFEAIQNGEEYTVKQYPNRYNIDSLPDKYLIEWARKTVNSAGSYREDITEVIRRGKNNLSDLEDKGYGGSYSAHYQRRVIEEYQAILDSKRMIGLESDHGWNAYYNYAAGDLLLFAFVMLLASALFLQEKQVGFWAMIRSTRRGRMATGMAKLTTLTVSVTIALLLFAGSSFAVHGLVCGYSSPHNVLQVLDSFRLSNLQITVGEYLPIHLLLKWSSALVFGTIVVLISLFLSHPAEAYIAGVAVFGSQYLLRIFPYLDADDPFRNLNLMTVSEAIRLTTRYRTLNVFGSAQPALLCWTVLASLLAIGLTVAILTLYGKAHLSFDRPSLFRKLLPKGLPRWKRTKESPKQRRAKGSVHTIFAWETYKRLIADRIWIVLVILLIAKCLVATDGIGDPLRYKEMIYHKYMTLYAGEWTEEKSAKITAKAEEIRSVIAQYAKMQAGYRQGEITQAEYDAYMANYYAASDLDGFFDAIVERDRYLRKVEEKSEITPSFVYDTGWNEIFGAESDLWLYFAILLLTAGIFSGEHQKTSSSGGFAPLLRTAVHGRKKTDHAKLLLILTATLILTVTFSAVDLLAASAKYDLPLLSASVTSLEAFAGLPEALTVGQWLALYLITKLFTALGFAIFVFALSAIIHQTLPVLCIALGSTLLPHLLNSMGVPLTAVDFQTYFAITPLWMAKDFTKWTIVAMSIALTAVLYWIGKRRRT